MLLALGLGLVPGFIFGDSGLGLLGVDGFVMGGFVDGLVGAIGAIGILTGASSYNLCQMLSGAGLFPSNRSNFFR